MNQEDFLELQKIMLKIDEVPSNNPCDESNICDFKKEHYFRKKMKNQVNPFPEILQSFPDIPPSFSPHFFRDFNTYFSKISLEEQKNNIDFLSYLLSSSSSKQSFQEIQPSLIFPFLFSNLPNSFSLLFLLLNKSPFHCSNIMSYAWPSHFLTILDSLSQEDTSKITFFLNIVKNHLDFHLLPQEEITSFHELIKYLLNYFFEVHSFEDQYYLIKILKIYSKQNQTARLFSFSQYQYLLPQYLNIYKQFKNNEQYLSLISITLDAFPETLMITPTLSEEEENDESFEALLFKINDYDMILQAISPLIFSENEKFQCSSCKYLQTFLVSNEFSAFLIQNVPEIIDRLFFLANEGSYKTRIEALIPLIDFIQLNDNNLLIYFVENKIISLFCSFLSIPDTDILLDLLQALISIGIFANKNNLIDQVLSEITEHLNDLEELEYINDKNVAKLAKHIINMINSCQLL